MTIKQQGGVFGRNPTFNDVDVEGELKVGGSALPSGANTAKLDTAQTFTANQTYKTTASDTDGITVRFENTDTSVSDNQSLGQIEWYGNDGSSGGTGVKGKIRTEAQAGSFGVGYDVVVSAGTQTGGSNLLRDVAKFTFGGNIVLPISGGGIDFSATSGTGTSELFDDYEEGTFSGSISGITATTATYAGTYTKLGNICHIQVLLTISGKTAGAGNPSIAVPFAAASTSTPQFGGQPTANGIFGSTDMYFAVYNGGTVVYAYNESGATLGAANWNDGVTAVNFTYKTA